RSKRIHGGFERAIGAEEEASQLLIVASGTPDRSLFPSRVVRETSDALAVRDALDQAIVQVAKNAFETTFVSRYAILVQARSLVVVPRFSHSPGGALNQRKVPPIVEIEIGDPLFTRRVLNDGSWKLSLGIVVAV